MFGGLSRSYEKARHSGVIAVDSCQFTSSGKRDDDQDAKALAALILPLPNWILPSTRFKKQTRELLLSLTASSQAA
jgi:hypothetical protein